MAEPFENPADIIEFVRKFQDIKIILTAIELKVFTTLDTHMLTLKEISEKLDVEEDSLSRLLNALVSLDLLHKVKDKYYNSHFAKTYLNENSNEFVYSLKHYCNTFERWSDLTGIIKPDFEGNDFSEAFISAMHYRAKKTADLIPLMINRDNIRRIIDIGGGSGVFLISFLKQLPEATGVLLDLPKIIPISKKFVKNEGMEERISFIEGSYHDADFGEGYDLAILSAILHINSALENEKLIQKTYNSLNKGGKILINEFILNEDETSPKRAVLFSINMLVGTKKGRSYKYSEIESWLKNTGFGHIELKPMGNDASLIVGEK
ncbi:MAG: methyltransferase domain-containing protein [Ignavibacteria bacterium]|nr:MAG: methyltransferase domain-containing protein [Ignavibacteria bacterium]